MSLQSLSTSQAMLWLSLPQKLETLNASWQEQKNMLERSNNNNNNEAFTELLHSVCVQQEGAFRLRWRWNSRATVSPCHGEVNTDGGSVRMRKQYLGKYCKSNDHVLNSTSLCVQLLEIQSGMPKNVCSQPALQLPLGLDIISVVNAEWEHFFAGKINVVLHFSKHGELLEY